MTVSHNRVYVVNSGDGSIFGFDFNPATGKLKALSKSHRNLSAVGTGPAQISFDRDVDALVVTEKATNKITSFSLNEEGLPLASHVIASTGTTPFGFSFGKHGQFFVAEAGFPIKAGQWTRIKLNLSRLKWKANINNLIFK